MKNINMNLNGNNVVVEVIGFDEYELLGYELIELLNQEGILPELVDNGILEVSNDRGGYYTIGGNEYKVFEGEESARQEAIKYNVEVLEDCGLNDDLLNIADIQGLIDDSWFVDTWAEIHEDMAYNEGLEYIMTDEQREELEAGDTDEDVIREEYFEALQSSIAGQEADEYKFQFGDAEYYRVLVDEGLIDLEELAEYCVDCDGVGHSLASYDGEELNMDELYAYRIN